MLCSDEGLCALVKFLAPETQAAALAWCIEMDTSSVEVIVAVEADDAFVSALGLKPGGLNMGLVRKRLAAFRDAM